MKVKSKEQQIIDGELLQIKNFIHDQFPNNDIKIYVTKTSVDVTGVSLTDKSKIVDFKFNFFKLFNKKIKDYISSDLEKCKNISFKYN